MADKPIEIVTSIDDDLLANSNNSAARVEVLVGGSVEYVLTEDTIEGTVTYDANASSRGRLDLTIAGLPELIPTQPDDLLAPYGNELRAYRGVELADRILLISLGIFPIQRATASEGDFTIRVSANDRSQLFSDAKFEASAQIAAGTDADDAILAILQNIDPNVQTDFAAMEVPLPLLGYEEGDDPWALAQGIAKACGGELYFGDNGEVVLRPIPSALQGQSVATFAEGVNLIGADRDWDRAEIYNRVKVTGENTSGDPDAAIPSGVAVDDNFNSPTYYNGVNVFGKAFGRKPLWYDEIASFIATDTQAQDAAQGKLARTLGLPDNVGFEALVDPARRPSDVVHLERGRLGLGESHILDQVTIPLAGSAGGMTAQTRVAQLLT